MLKLVLLTAISANWILVVSSSASPRKCKRNEEYSDCINDDCDVRKCSQLGQPGPCVELDSCDCISGCVCKEDYLRSDNGTCIKKTDCPSCGGDPNATTGCGTFCNRCSGPIPCPKICEVNACECKDGYIYDENIEKCVLKKHCTPTCKKHEVYSDCINGGCDARNCTQLGKDVPCVKLDPEDCIKGCVCENGYLRDHKGNCIPKKKCPSCGDDPNATAGCGTFCTQCRGSVPCPKICKVNGCECKEGYVYDPNIRKCVLKKNCTPTCKTNEVFSNCTQIGCGPKNCTQLGKPVPCVKIDPKFCLKGCICAQGYLRAENGTCIKLKDCPSCGDDPNAESGCGAHCTRCSNYNKGPFACPRVCLPNSCNCRKGFIYDQNIGKCVKPEDCTPTCKTNEVFSNCTQIGCGPKNCSQLGKPVPCVRIDPKFCIKGCVCAEGYVRADNGTCIKIKDCPSCGDDPNAESGCSIFCKRCSNYGKGPAVCTLACKLNGCECKKDFIYDQNTKKCVRPEQCTPTCNTNEVFSDCTQSGCAPKNCSELGVKPVPCNRRDPRYCTEGCICKQSHVRADNGTCINIKNCPSCGGDPNAEAGCGGFCTRCTNYGKGPVACTAGCQLNSCDCKEGFIYDEFIQKCVRPENCSTSCGGDPNAKPGCGGFCTRCSNYGQGVACALACQSDGCDCKKGFIYDEIIGKCVRPENCSQKKCSANEEFDPCPDCNPRRCETKDSVFHCPLIPADPSDPRCKPQCRCKKGFFKNYKGVCVPAADCEKCDGPNEFFECGPVCDNLCGKSIGRKNCNIQNVKCNPKCYCKDGFARAANETCIPVKDCPPPTCSKPNEVYDPCDTPCPARRCDFNADLVRCKAPPKVGDKECLVGCRCKDGFFKNDKNVCVRREQCQKKCSANEEFDPCPDCNPRQCETKDSVFNCPLIPADPSDPRCKPQCRCKKGFFKNYKGVCVPAADCEKCDGPNEFFECGPECDNVCGSKIGRKNCNIQNVKCNPKCYCKDGFARAANKTCIPVKDCPPSCPGPNEMYDPCASPCPSRQCGFDDRAAKCMRPPEIGDKECLVGCRCKNGFYRNNKGICVRWEDCQKKCSANEEFDPCPDCNPRQCETKDSVFHCPLIPADPSDPRCKPQCRCKKGFFKNYKGVCVPAADCEKCDGPNEFFECGPVCDNLCDRHIGRKNCNIQNIKCNPKCYCKDGFARDANKKCIPVKDCPRKCQKNEEYSTCANGLCRLENCSQYGNPIPFCPKFDETKCVGGCVCIDKYLRFLNGACIPEDQCQDLVVPFSNTTAASNDSEEED